MIKDLFRKRAHVPTAPEAPGREPEVPAGLWRKCNKCGKAIYTEDVIRNYYICPKCNGYFRVHAYRRVESLADVGSFEEWDREMPCSNPLSFPGYEKKWNDVQTRTSLNAAVVTGKVSINGFPAVLGVMDARFFMGSMGHNVGEKITRAVERATKKRLPVILFTCSGGARMQEGMISLMQMAKTSAALKRHSDAGLLSVIVLTDPTTGGVTASFAMLGDIILAEPNALIGFAGPRVIEQTIRQKLPAGFQRAEFQVEHGFVDAIVKREEMKDTLTKLLMLHQETKNCREEETGVSGAGVSSMEETRTEPLSGEAASLEEQNSEPTTEQNGMSAWDRVLVSRMAERPTGLDYINELFSDFMEFHGDRCFKDDGAIVGGIARFHDIPVTVIAQQKGKNTKDNIKCNFGMPSPDGYRKALRLMKEAEKFNRPVICFVDTPGAFCGLEAEERGQGEAIARNLYELSSLSVPVLSIVIGEGGSGGALALAVADEVWMLENAIYSILSPEGFASILWKDAKRAADAAQVMKITAADLKELGVIEEIIHEETPASMETISSICQELDGKIRRFFRTYGSMDREALIQKRYDRFRAF